MKKEMHAVCLFPIRGTIPCTFLLKIFHIVNSANTFVTEKLQNSNFITLWTLVKHAGKHPNIITLVGTRIEGGKSVLD